MVCSPPYKMVQKKNSPRNGPKNGPKNGPVHILPYAIQRVHEDLIPSMLGS